MHTVVLPSRAAHTLTSVTAVCAPCRVVAPRYAAELDNGCVWADATEVTGPPSMLDSTDEDGEPMRAPRSSEEHAAIARAVHLLVLAGESMCDAVALVDSCIFG